MAVTMIKHLKGDKTYEFDGYSKQNRGRRI